MKTKEVFPDLPEHELDIFENQEGREMPKAGGYGSPYILKDKTFLSPGTWNGYFYSKDAIASIYKNTTWNDETLSLYYDHKSRSADMWVGEVKNVRLMDDGRVVGDVYVVSPDAMHKLAYGARFGISPKITGYCQPNTANIYTGKFEDFSIVKTPAVRTAYLNSDNQPVAEYRGRVDENDIIILLNSQITEKPETESTSDIKIETQTKMAEIPTPKSIEEPKAPAPAVPAEPTMAKKEEYPKPFDAGEGEPKKKEEDENKYPPVEPKKEEMSTEELFSIFTNAGFISFKNKYATDHPDANIMEIVNAYKEGGKALSEIEDKLEKKVAELQAKIMELSIPTTTPVPKMESKKLELKEDEFKHAKEDPTYADELMVKFLKVMNGQLPNEMSIE